jgi:hypothetical protein
MGKRADGGSARRFTVPAPKGQRVSLPPNHRATVNGESLFPSRVMHASVLPRLLIGGHNAAKIGKDVRKGRWNGMPVFTLTLEERATCPATCRQWAGCYGNNMHLARRVIADETFERRLWAELAVLHSAHPAGFVVRLHILGDFYSLDYVRLWDRALEAFPALRVFGYTAHDPDGEIGSELLGLTLDRWDRFALRFSGWGMDELGAEVIDAAEDVPHGAFVCPAQTGKTERCGTCGLCWETRRPVAFLRH